jgi:hypothetical protein
MSEQLTTPPSRPQSGKRRSSVRRAVVQAAVIVLVLVAAGALAGLLWEWLWTPPSGVVVDHQWVQDEEGLRNDFSGTGLYVAVGALAGLLLGAAVALVFDRDELVTLAAVVFGSLLAAWVMYRVGLSLGPPDPAPLAEAAKDATRLPGTLEVAGESPFVAFPSGVLVGLLVVFFGLSRRRGPQG